MSEDLSIRAKIHIYHGQMIIAICDADLMGRTLDNKGVPFKITESFYGGPLIGEEDLVSLLRQGGNMNIIGKRCISIAMDRGFVTPDQIILIEGVPHGQVYRVRE